MEMEFTEGARVREIWIFPEDEPYYYQVPLPMTPEIEDGLRQGSHAHWAGVLGYIEKQLGECRLASND